MSTPTDPTVMLLRSFCLATMAGQYEEVMQRAEKEGWSHRQVLRHLCESEAVERGQKRTVRLLAESGLPETKTLSTLDEALLPVKVRRQLPALIEGGFVDRAVNVLAFGLPGRGKTHFLAALGRELILRHSKRVLFRPTFKLVGQLLAAKRDLRLANELKKLDRYDVLILDDLGYVQQSREEMEGKRPKIDPLVRAMRPARLGPCLLQKHPGPGDVTDGPPKRGSWKWRWPQLSQAP